MAFDIYGNNLRDNHCEVHPWVHETYPCTICFREGELQKMKKRKPEPIDNRLHPNDPLHGYPALSDWLEHVGCYGAGQAMREWGQIVTICREMADALDELHRYNQTDIAYHNSPAAMKAHDVLARARGEHPTRESAHREEA